jgi:hypothetical protein
MADADPVRLLPAAPDPARLAPFALRGLVGLLHFLGDKGADPIDFAAALARWKALPEKKTGKQAEKLGLKSLDRLAETVETACALGSALPNTTRPEQRRAASIGLLRLLARLDLIRSRKAGLPDPGQAVPLVNDETGRLHARAIELLVRAAITESYADQALLVERLREWQSKVADKWLNIADDGDVLSGFDLKDLAALFVNVGEFPARYAVFYRNTPFLQLNGTDKRKTLELFLDDACEIRNRIAHHKPLTGNQVALLNLYWDDVAIPMAEAHAHQVHAAVDPAPFVRTDDGLAGWVAELQRHAARTEEDSAFLKETTGLIKEDTSVTRKRVAVVLCLGVLIAIGVGATLFMTGGIRSGVGDLQVAVKSVKQEVSTDPQKELANLGVPWTWETYFQSVADGKVREAKLFAAAGMPLHDPEYAVCQLIQRKSPNFNEMLDLIVTAGLDVKASHPNCQNLRQPPEPLLTGAVRAANGPAVDSLLAHGVRVTRPTFKAFDDMNSSDFTTGRPAAFTSKYRPLLESRISQQSALLPAEELRARGYDIGPTGVISAITQHDVGSLRLFSELKTSFSQDDVFEKLCGMVDSYDDDLSKILVVLRSMGFDINRPSRACSASAQPARTLLTLAIMSRNDRQTRALLNQGAKPTRETIEALQIPFGRMDGRLPDASYPARWQPILEQAAKGTTAPSFR